VKKPEDTNSSTSYNILGWSQEMFAEIFEERPKCADVCLRSTGRKLDEFFNLRTCDVQAGFPESPLRVMWCFSGEEQFTKDGIKGN
jgi:hypothetical protein